MLQVVGISTKRKVNLSVTELSACQNRGLWNFLFQFQATFFQSQNDPVQIVIDEEGTLDIFIYLLPDTELNENVGGTWSIATIYMHPISTGESELLYGENTRLRDANNDSVVVKSFGSGYINVE